VGDADVFEGDVEFAGAFEEVGADLVADGFTLGDEFGGVEAGDDGFEDFVADGGEDSLVVVLAETLYNTSNISIHLPSLSHLPFLGASCWVLYVLGRSSATCPPPADAAP